MLDRPEWFKAAIDFCRIALRRCTAICARGVAFLLLIIAVVGPAAAQDSMAPAIDSPAMDSGAPPMSQSGGGDIAYFSQDLGTILRLKYSTESYGQDGRGNFDIGTMQVVTLGDTAAFLDGQVTMNENDGVGFNIGLGYRWMDIGQFSGGPARMQGISLWADGTHTDAGNFFPQVGISYESLGEMWDIRANGYIPIGQREQVGAFKPTNEVGFNGNFLVDLTQATVDRSFYAADLEIARRLGSQRDAWGFAGPYFVANDTDDSAGFRVGVRGYAYPDLLLQFAVSHDDVFDTNATFSVAWFVGRTRTNFRPACGTPDRFREPVMRNDYVVLSHTGRQSGTALTQNGGQALRFVHVDSNAPPGGDGSFEHPLNNLNDIQAHSDVTPIVTGSNIFNPRSDIILVHGGSTFSGQTAVLQERQAIWGEGNNELLPIATVEHGTINLPESSPGARSKPRPVISNAPAPGAIVLDNTNEVINFTIDGGVAGIVAGPNGSGSAAINKVTIRNTTGDGIHLTSSVRTDVEDVNGNGNTTEKALLGGYTIHTVTLQNIGGDGISIDDTLPAGVSLADPNVKNNEVIALTNITSTNGNGFGINIANTHAGTGNTTTLNTYTYNGGTTSAGGIRLNNFNGSFDALNGTLTGGTAASKGVEILGDSDGAITFESTVAFNNLGGTAFNINGDATNKINGSISVAGPITNAVVSSVKATNVGAGGTVTFSGDISTDASNPETGDSIAVTGNETGSSFTFSGKLTLNSEANGFVAQGGGTLSVPGTVNTVAVDDGQAVLITDMNIAGTGVNFSHVDRGAGGTLPAIQLSGNTGGAIVLGTPGETAGQSGTIESGTANAIEITNSANATISALQINNSAGVSGVRVENSGTTTSTVNLNDLNIAGGGIGVETVGGGTGNITMTVNDTAITGSTTEGMLFNNVDHGSVQNFNVTINGNNAAAGAKGVLITDSDASISFDSASSIQNFGSTDFEVSGGKGVISYAGQIINASAVNAGDTTGRSIHVHDTTGGSVTFTAASSVNDDNDGMLVENNTGSFSFLGTSTFNTTGNAVEVIDTQTVNLQNIHVVNTGGAGNGVTLTHDNSATTAMSVTLNNLTIDAASGNGVFVNANSTEDFALKFTNSDSNQNVAMLANGAGHFGLLVDNNDITTTGAGNDAFALMFGGAAANGDVTIRNNNHFLAGDARALFIDNTAGPTVRLLVEDSTFQNTSAAFSAADIRGENTSTLEATIQGNQFQTTGGADDFTMTSFNTANIRLNLGGSGADKNTAGGNGIFHLVETPGSDFDVVDTTNTFNDSRNNGHVNPTPAAGSFDNIPPGTPPPLPTVPP
jgi:hypothetical protein